MIAGSASPGAIDAGGSSTIRSFMSPARKIMYSKISSRGGTCRSAGRSSVPYDRTLAKAIVDSLGSIVYRIPSYLISDLEINEILQPRNGVVVISIQFKSIAINCQTINAFNYIKCWPKMRMK